MEQKTRWVNFCEGFVGLSLGALLGSIAYAILHVVLLCH